MTGRDVTVASRRVLSVGSSSAVFDLSTATDRKAESLVEGLAKRITDGLAEGIANGLAEDLAEGIAEDLAEGFAEGLAEGIAGSESDTSCPGQCASS